MLDIKDRIRLIKYHRMKPEERFLYDIFVDLDTYIHKDYPTFIFFKRGNDLLFDYNFKNGYFWCDHSKIWHVLQIKYGLTERFIRPLIIKMVKDYLFKNMINPTFIRWDSDLSSDKKKELKKSNSIGLDLLINPEAETWKWFSKKRFTDDDLIRQEITPKSAIIINQELINKKLSEK